MSADDSEMMNYLVRMVVPMRREFGHKLDVGQFMHDFKYAAEVLEQARSSQDPRLREYGVYVEKRQHGARIADSAGPAPSPWPSAKSAVAAGTPAPAPAVEKASEEELRARVMKKYTSGLR
jgi:hypothetical protein